MHSAIQNDPVVFHLEKPSKKWLMLSLTLFLVPVPMSHEQMVWLQVSIEQLVFNVPFSFLPKFLHTLKTTNFFASKVAVCCQLCPRQATISADVIGRWYFSKVPTSLHDRLFSVSSSNPSKSKINNSFIDSLLLLSFILKQFQYEYFNQDI